MPAKIVLIGAGSYVFTPSTLHDLLCDHKLSDLELWLVDPDVELINDMAGIAKRMADESGVRVETHCVADRRDALSAADFVITSFAIQGAKRWETDRQIAERHGVFDPTGELGGIGGLSYTLRQVRVMLDVCADMAALCPKAWLLNVSNPLPRIMTAVSLFAPIRNIGFCNAAFGGVNPYESVARMLDRPWDSFTAVSAGVNHFNWLLCVEDAATGEDLYPQVRDHMRTAGWPGQPLTTHCFRQYNYLPLPGDTHIAEFLPFDAERMKHCDAAFHGSPEERHRRRTELGKMARGEIGWRKLLEHRSWERPADVIHAMITRAPLALPMVNVLNDGLIEELPGDALVEGPCRIEEGRLERCPVGPLPEAILPMIRTTAEVNTLAAKAAATNDREMLHAVIDVDPGIANKSGAHRAIDEMTNAHADLLPAWV